MSNDESSALKTLLQQTRWRMTAQQEADELREHISKLTQQHQRDLELITKAKAAALEEENHRTRKTRSTERDDIINQAQKRAQNPSDARSIYAALREMALENPDSPLVGYDGYERALKWEKWDDKTREKNEVLQKEKDAIAAIRRYLLKSH